MTFFPAKLQHWNIQFYIVFLKLWKVELLFFHMFDDLLTLPRVKPGSKLLHIISYFIFYRADGHCSKFKLLTGRSHLNVLTPMTLGPAHTFAKSFYFYSVQLHFVVWRLKLFIFYLILWDRHLFNALQKTYFYLILAITVVCLYKVLCCVISVEV